MEIKKNQINIVTGVSGSGKKEFVLDSLNIRNYHDLYQDRYKNMKLDDVLGEQTNSKRKKEEALQMIGFPMNVLNKQIKEFSIGELKKITIAYTLCKNADTYVFMYPGVGLDTRNKNSLIKVFRLLKNRYKKTIVIVSNDCNWFHQFADHLILVHNGEVVKEGTTYDIFCNSTLCRKYKIEVPKIIQFERMVLRKKRKKLGYRNDIKDLIKDIYRNI